MINIRPMSYGSTFDGVRVLGRLLAPDDMTWTTEVMAGAGTMPFVLHLSCLAHFTPHVPYAAQKIMQRIDIDCPIFGGPENCCGAIHQHLGDERFAASAAKMALLSFRRVRPTTVLSICPDCDESFAAHPLPGKSGFHHSNVSELFVMHLDTLKPLMKPLRRRIVLHAHANNASRIKDASNIETIMSAIPGVEVVNGARRVGPGTHCQILGPMPPEDRHAMFEEARDCGADTLVMPYHSCYRQHLSGELRNNVRVEHYMTVLAESPGIEVPETYKALRMLNDVDAAVASLRPRFEAFGYTDAQIRPLIQSSIYL